MPVMTNSSQSYERSKRTPIHQLIDLDQYPIHDLDSNAGRDLVSKCQQSLADTAAALLIDFVRPDALSRMATEAEQLVEIPFTVLSSATALIQTYPGMVPTAPSLLSCAAHNADHLRM